MNNKNEVKNDDILNMIVQEDNIDTEAIIKCELFLERIFFPKYVKSVDSGEFAIFSGYITKRIENCPETLESIKLKGTVPTLEYGTTYKVFAKFESHHDLYGDTYSIIYMNKCVDISSKDKQKEFLRCVLNENLVEKLFEKYEDVIELLENKDVEALTSVKGIGNQVALKMIDEYNRSKDYSQVYIELGQMGFTDNFIRKLVEFYHSPDVAIDKVKNNPYDLVRIDGVGFKKADEIGCKAGIDKFSPHRIKAFLYYTLDEQGEAGKSYLLYQELMKTMYDTLGFIPEEVISEVAKRMIDNGEIVVLDNGNKISLKKYYNLEKNIMNELIRLQIGKIDIVETEEYKDEDYIESELHKDYVPKIFNTSDWEDKVKKIEEVQGFEFTDEQKAAIELSINNNVIAITGGGGVGKSSVAKGVCNIYTHPSIVACALSGKAALRITEATGLAASTIHRALGWYQGEFTYNKNNKLPADIVLIDEATMINGYLFHSLLQAIPIGCKVIILGDAQQLTPIGNCQVFADILDANIIPCVRLTKIHRQAAKSGIIPTSIKIAHQEQIFENNYVGNSILGELQDMEFDITSDKDNLADKVISHFQTEMNKFNEIMEVQICVAKRLDGNLSCYNLNNRIQEIYNPVFGKDNNNSFEIALESKKNKDEIKKYVIRVGDKVINVKNNYRCATPDGGETAVFNGNMGIVKDITDKGIVKIDFAGIGEVLFDKSSRNALELGYACTIHKCVTADTIVYSDKGLITIDELNNGAKELENKEITTDIKIYNGNYMEKPLNFYNAGLTKCKKIITSRGYKLIATNDHRVDVLDTDGYIVTKHISDVTDDDYMILSVGSNVYGNSIKLNYSVDEKELDKRAKIYKYPKYMTKEFARFLGYMVADGTISQCGLAYGKNHKNVVIDFDNIVYQLFGYDRGTEPTNVLPDGVLGGMYLSAINSKYIKKYCEQIEGIQPNNKFVPKVILSSPKEYQIEFLRGVFEDGSVCVKNDKFDHISFTCKEEKTVDQINMMLLNMGIICTKYHRKTEIYDSYTLFIYGEYCDKFIKTIGFISNEKSERAFKYYEIEHGQSERKSIPYVINVISDIANDKGIKLRDIHRELLRAKRRNTMTKSLLGKVLNWFNEKGINDLRIDYLRSIYENMYFDKIKSIEEVEEHTYCIEMPITHRFIQNGFYGWNCQGSGFLSTIVGMSTDSFIMNNSELLYTGITRAKKYCILVGNNYAISKAIKTKEVKNKQTFLRDMLIENKDRLKGE